MRTLVRKLTMGLTHRQQKFIVEYLKDQNGTQAAIRAGYSASGADVQAIRLLKNPLIKNEIEEKIAKIAHQLDISAVEVVRVIKSLLTYDIRDILNPDGTVKPPSEWPEGAAFSVQGFDVTELYEGSGSQKHVYGNLKKIKFADRIRAAELLTKILGMLSPEKLEISGPNGSPIKVGPAIDFSTWQTEDLEKLNHLQQKYLEMK